MQVELDERRLANLGLSVDLVTNRLAQENVNLTGGRLREGQTEFLVRTVNEFERSGDMNDIVIASERRAQSCGCRMWRTCVRGHKEREVITRIDGRESVEVAIYKEGGTNTVTVSEKVQTALEELKTRLVKLDPDLSVTLITDQARYIRQSVATGIPDRALSAASWPSLSCTSSCAAGRRRRSSAWPFRSRW